jgi:hypothetical protein
MDLALQSIRESRKGSNFTGSTFLVRFGRRIPFYIGFTSRNLPDVLLERRQLRGRPHRPSG